VSSFGDNVFSGLSNALRKSTIVRFLKPNYLPTYVALMVVIATGLFAEQQNRAVHAAKMPTSTATFNSCVD
jgi:sensor domain CHASE-containing protein